MLTILLDILKRASFITSCYNKNSVCSIQSPGRALSISHTTKIRILHMLPDGRGYSLVNGYHIKVSRLRCFLFQILREIRCVFSLNSGLVYTIWYICGTKVGESGVLEGIHSLKWVHDINIKMLCRNRFSMRPISDDHQVSLGSRLHWLCKCLPGSVSQISLTLTLAGAQGLRKLQLLKFLQFPNGSKPVET